MRHVFAIALTLSLPLSIADARTYSVIDLGDLAGGDDLSSAQDINDFGQVVGGSIAADGYRAFLWQNGRGMLDLGVLNGDNRSSTSAINNRGQVVGLSSTTSAEGWSTRTFQWNDTNGMTILDETVSSPTFLHPFAMNEEGQVVGMTGTSGIFEYEAFLWDEANNLALLKNNAIEPFRMAMDINEKGTVAGTSQLEGNEGTGRALVWSEGTTTDLGTLSDVENDNYAVAWAINNHDQVVGYSGLSNGVRAYIWNAEQGMMNLGPTDASVDLSVAQDINDAGHVIGVTDEYAFVWTEEDGMIDLNTLLDASGDGWAIGYVKSINEHGQIVGAARNPANQFHAFLLNPIPDEGMAGDFDFDGDFDVADIDSLGRQIAALTDNLPFDVTGDGIVDTSDLQEWLSIAANATPQANDLFALGDLDLDGVVGSVDLGKLLNNFGDSGDIAYSAGNLNSDKIVDSIDLGLLLNNFEAQATGLYSVPEPTMPAWLVVMSALGLINRVSNPFTSPTRNKP